MENKNYHYWRINGLYKVTDGPSDKFKEKAVEVSREDFLETAKWMIPIPFNGTPLSFIKADGTVAYTNKMTPEEYIIEKGCFACNDSELTSKIEGYYKALEHPLSESDEETFWEMMSVLPPERSYGDDEYEYFFVGEPYSGPVHGFYASYRGRWFSGKRNKHTTHEKLLSDIREANERTSKIAV